MYFVLNRADRSGSILQIMLYIYAYCRYHNISYDGLISKNRVWWYNANFFDNVSKFLNIMNRRTDIGTLNEINFDEISYYKNKESKDIFVEFIVV